MMYVRGMRNVNALHALDPHRVSLAGDGGERRASERDVIAVESPDDCKTSGDLHR